MVGKNLAEDPYEHLANAIILSAVSDYRAALKRVKRNQGSKTAMDEVFADREILQKSVISATGFSGWRVFDKKASG